MNISKDSRGVAMPVMLVAVSLIAVIVAIVWISNNSGSQQTNVTSDAMMKKETNEAVFDADKDEMMEDKDDSMAKKDETVMAEKSDGIMEKQVPSGYVSYSAQVYADAQSQKRVLFFHASWCPTCKAAHADFTANASKIPTDVVVFKTDYDTQTALKSKYGVTYQHTFVQVDSDGNALAKWNGGDIDELLKRIK